MRRTTIRLATWGVALAALAGIATSNIDAAWSYFTDSSYATGGIQIKVKPDTDITEEFDNREKRVTIVNNEVSVPVYVRAKVYANPTYLETISGTNWTGPDADGWYYYQAVLMPGDPTEQLLARIKFPVDPDNPEDPIANDPEYNFNVIVVYEATPDVYNEDGSAKDPQAADWTLRLDDQEGE